MERNMDSMGDKWKKYAAVLFAGIISISACTNIYMMTPAAASVADDGTKSGQPADNSQPDGAVLSQDADPQPAGNSADNPQPAGNSADNPQLTGNSADNQQSASDSADNQQPAGNPADNQPSAGHTQPGSGEAGGDIQPDSPGLDTALPVQPDDPSGAGGGADRPHNNANFIQP